MVVNMSKKIIILILLIFLVTGCELNPWHNFIKSKDEIVDKEEKEEKEENEVVAKTVPLKITTTGSLAIGKSIMSIDTDKDMVVIRGKEDILNEIDYIPIEVGIEGLSKNTELDISLGELADEVIVMPSSVKVNIKIGKTEFKSLIISNIEVRNLAPEYKVNVLENASVPVIISGYKDVLTEISENDIKAYIDLEGFKEGNYEMDVILETNDYRITLTGTKKINISISN